MKTRNGKMKLTAAALAVQGVFAALYAMPAHAQDEPAGSLRVPANFVEFGGLGVSDTSAKFGEYTGLNKSGGYFLGNFDARGGDAYGEGNGTTRWEFRGDDLGLTSRSLGATMSNQGRWNFGINFDQLTHYTSDSYQTPYLGDMGGNRWVLPAGFGSVPTAAPGTRVLTAAQLAAFHNVDINNTRENTSLFGGLVLNRQWNVKVDYNHLDQSGAKLMGFGAYGSAAVGGAGTGEKVAILPMPTNYNTDTVNVALNWLGEKSNATLSYFGSFFHENNNNGVQFQTFTGVTNIQTMGTPPSNNFNQVNLTGGYQFSKRTKLAGGLSYGTISQDAAYAYDTFAMVTPSPTSSLNGDVRTTHADVKLTDQTTRNLILSGGLKYDYRDNRTASNIYNFNAISGGNTANYPNPPLSFKKSQAELAGDYSFTARQKVRLAYNHDDTHRFCNQYASGGGTPPYAPGTDCVTVFRTMEDRLSAGYRVRAMEGVSFNAGYSYSDRRSDRDENARAPMIGLDGNLVVAPALPGLTPANITGINAGEFRGFNPFFEASRKQNQLKGGVNWEAAERLSFGANGRLTDDNYGTTFGMQNGRSWSVNLDGTYIYSERGSVTAYLTQQERTRDMTNEQRSPTTNTAATQTATAILIPPGGTWNNNLKDTDTTIGLNVKQGGLMGGRLELSGDATYSLAKTRYNTTLNYATTTTTGLTCADPSIYTCVPLPDIRSELFIFKVSGVYQLNKSTKVKAGYWYQHLKADDFYYNGLQTGFTPTSVLPTNQTAPSYNVNVVYGSFIYNF